ncbi:MAG: nucleotidyltransferase domain-containing protein [Sporomusaceae bacterium]|nr:nucleotidyltransferase domain-containing protein [Sporomusaceae bacterium]
MNLKKIILLGSMAIGSIHEDSNIDLIIIKDTNKDFDTRLKEIKSMKLPTLLGDMMVFTPTEFKIREAIGRFQKYYLVQSKVRFEKR